MGVVIVQMLHRQALKVIQCRFIVKHHTLNYVQGFSFQKDLPAVADIADIVSPSVAIGVDSTEIHPVFHLPGNIAINDQSLAVCT